MQKTSSGFFVPSDYARNTRTLYVSGVLQASVPEAPVDDGNDWDMDVVSLILTPTQYRPQARAMIVTGNSMNDGSPKAIQNGDIVLVDPNILGSVYHNTRRTVLQTNNGYIVKERGIVNGKHLLLSANPDYPPIRHEPDFRMVGIVYARYLGQRNVQFL